MKHTIEVRYSDLIWFANALAFWILFVSSIKSISCRIEYDTNDCLTLLNLLKLALLVDIVFCLANDNEFFLLASWSFELFPPCIV